MGGFSKSYLERWFQYRLYYGSDNHCIDIHAGGCLATESYDYNTM